MANRKIREKLVLKPVDEGHLEQFNKLLRYVFQVTSKDLLEGGYEDGELIRSKLPMLERADVFGWFNGDNLVSQVCIYPCTVNIHGRIYDMGGITGVGTYPEYAGIGLMSDLLRVALKSMREKRQWISYLYPYNIPFYRHKGWEIMSDMVSFTVSDAKLPKQVDVPGYVERGEIDHPDVLKTYDHFARRTHGALIRNEDDWEEYWRWENEEERIAAVYYNEKREPTGFVIYWVEQDIFHIKEMVYLDMESRKGLWNFIGAHYSMIDEVQGKIYKNEPLAFFLDDSEITETITPYYMARIVDVKAFLELFPFIGLKTPFHFVVSDPVAEWNNGIFCVAGTENGKNRITDEPLGNPIALSIQTLSALLMNYRSASYFADLERIRTDTETVKMLENIIPNQEPYFSDYF
ncbi:GNAT family N-acetyltransferase [Oxalobacter vibrioformis]|uniref:GNAT family N-acetyltransferase n=1 Tax=Oxalobacter vibrioformis TaxID=933080 RepID=A0A9E9P2C7_9BURK|nr:GNAT family N-acetyltransferase [Oxalobacter vibrioformis]WAW09762.1 GNAT family N-acetyltransferase [Oxalobacter vibrioformis]